MINIKEIVDDDNFIKQDEVVKKIGSALDRKLPFSLVRINDIENILMSQESIMRMEDILALKVCDKEGQAKNGITLPNLKLRDQLVDAVKKADVVGILAKKDTVIKAQKFLKRPLTDRVFGYYQIKPAVLCNSVVHYQLSHNRSFWNLFKGKKVMLVTKMAENLKKILEEEPYSLNISLTYSFKHYDQIPHALKTIKANQDRFDAVLLSCGANAVILAPNISESTGKCAIDFGNIKKMGFTV